MSGKAEETIYFELILNVLGADFFKKNKQLNSPKAKELLPYFNVEK